LGVLPAIVAACGAASLGDAADVQVNGNRPTHGITADTIPPGMLQSETGASYLRDASGAEPLHRFTLEGQVRVGVWEGLEASVAAAFLRNRGPEVDASGIGDTTVAAKWRLMTDQDWRPAFAVQPFVKLPTGNRTNGLGSGRVDFGATFAASKTFFDRITLTPNLTLTGVSLADEPGGLFLQKAVALPAFLALTDQLTLFWEIFYQSRDRPGGSHGLATDFGAIVTVHRRVALDVAGEFGLAGTWPTWVVRGGITILLGSMPNTGNSPPTQGPSP
jgi:hypothetical protein